MSSFDFSYLSPEQRLTLIGELWESLDANAVEPTQAQKNELDRRLATLDDDIKQGRNASDIIADLEQRFPLRSVRLTQAAELELVDAIAWYDTQLTGLGVRFLDEFISLTERLSENPLQFPTVYKNTRRAPFSRFPYGLYFRVVTDEVEVFACFHFSRNPVQWQRRS